jgi:hypothetical protein
VTDEQKKPDGTTPGGAADARPAAPPAKDKFKGTMVAGTPAFSESAPQATRGPGGPKKAAFARTVRMGSGDLAAAVAKVEAAARAAGAQGAGAAQSPPAVNAGPVHASAVISVEPGAGQPPAQPAPADRLPSATPTAAGAVAPAQPGRPPQGGFSPVPPAWPADAAAGPPAAAEATPAPAAAEAASVSVSAPAGPIAQSGAAAPIAQSGAPGPIAQSYAPQPKSNALRYVVIASVLGIVGLVLLAAVGGFGYYFYSAKQSAPQAAAPTVSDETTAEGEATATDVAAATAAEEPAPEGTAASAEDAGAAAQTAAADEPPVLLTCTPACDQLDSIVCDSQPSELAKGGLVLSPGKHECVFTKRGYIPRKVTFVIKEGQRSEETVKLAPLGRRPAQTKQEPCGTFINPCK